MIAYIMVIGVGNPYRGDDGVGPFIAGKLKKENLPGTLVKTHSGEGTSLMESWKGASKVILIDAMRSGALPGKVRRFDALSESIPSDFFHYSTHAFSIAEAVELARVMDRLPPHLIIYGIEGKNFEKEIGLSPEVDQASREVEKRVINTINEEKGDPN